MNKLTVYSSGKSIIIIEDSTREYLTVEDKQIAISNFSSWILTGRLSGIPNKEDIKP